MPLALGMGMGMPFGGANPLAAYAAGGIKPATVLDFALDRYLGTVSAFSDLTHAATSNGTVIDSDGLLKWRAHNLQLQSEDISETAVVWGYVASAANVDATTWTAAATADFVQTRAPAQVTPVPGAEYMLEALVWTEVPGDVGKDMTITASMTGQTNTSTNFTLSSTPTLVSVSTGTITAATALALRLVFSNTGSATIKTTKLRIYRSDLGGMQNNPLTGDSYVATTTAAVYMPRFDYASGARRLLIEPTAATNLLLNSGTLSTQNVTTTAQAYTLHFTGTGTVTLSGTSTAGPLVGTGTGESNRVSLTFTPTAGTLTLTVTGTVTNAQFEAGSVPTSYIPTAGVTAARAAETIAIPAAKIAAYTTAVGFAMSGEMTDQGVPLRWYVDANNYITQTINGDGDVVFEQANAGTVDNAESTTAYTLGVNVPFSIAGRHGSTFVQGAADGTANTANTTPTAVMDGSATDIQLAYSGGPMRIEKFIMWNVDIGETGIEEIST